MSKITLILRFALWLLPTLVFGQEQRVIDSLESVLVEKTGNDRFDPLIDLAILFVNKDNERALLFMEKAHSIALSSGDSSWIVKCMRIRGQILQRSERADEAVAIFRDALKVAERNGLDNERFRILTAYAVTLTYRSQYDKALEMYSVAREMAIAQKDTSQIRLALNNLGVVYYKLKDYSKALRVWQAAVELQKTTLADDFRPFVNISLAYANLKDFSNARKALNNCLKVCGKSCADEAMVHIKYASGFIFFGLNDYANAKRDFLQSYKLSKKTHDMRMLLDNIYLLADVHQKQGRADLALSYLLEGEKIIEHGVKFNLEIIKIYQRFSELYLRQANFRKAAQYQAKYINLKDSIYSEELTTSLMKAEADHLERYNKAQIASQKEMILLKEEVIERQMTLNVVMVILAMFILACCLVLYRNFRLKQVMNLSLEKRIRARTRELECSRNDLVAMLNERDVLLSRAEKEILETLRTIKGLCHTGKEDLNRFATDSYLEKIEKASGRLSAHLSLLFETSKVRE